GAKGYYDQTSKRIVISEGMSELQNIKTLIHETAHAMLHDKDYLETTGEQKDRFTKEVEAESVAYTVCSYLDLPTEEYSFGYIAGWSGQKRIDAVRESLETIKECSSNIIGELEKRLVPDKSVRLTAEVAQEKQSKSLVI
ncbi:MAG TPA: DNA repair protein, partial [Ruminococcaceae bacterium]|nr:DNA repair protein [Oscillospiraceae bacterium]